MTTGAQLGWHTEKNTLMSESDFVRFHANKVVRKPIIDNLYILTL